MQEGSCTVVGGGVGVKPSDLGLPELQLDTITLPLAPLLFQHCYLSTKDVKQRHESPVDHYAS